MPSRRDQLLSYQLMVQRVLSAFTYRDAELARVPFPRAAGTLFLSAMVAVLVLAGVGIYGLLSPGGKTTWREDQALIVEKETGARYVYLNGRLHPVLNYVSARLILKQAKPSTVNVSRSSMRGTPRGATLGIAGAPDTLPEPGRLRTDPWVLCSRSGVGQSGQSTVTAALHVGRPSDPGQRVGEQALLVSHPDGSVFLVWHNHRFLIRRSQLVLNALALGQAPVVSVSPAWINALPQGPDVGPIDIPSRGSAAPLRDALVGQIVVTQTQSGESQYGVVLVDGVADITQVQADIVLNDPATAVAYQGRRVQPLPRTDLATAKRSQRVLLPAKGPNEPPSRTPRIVAGAGQGALCATFTDIDAVPEVTTGARLPPQSTGTVAAPAGRTTVVDEVLVPAGDGVLVESLVAPGAPAGTLVFVSDVGIRYQLVNRDVVSHLGYAGRPAVRLPAALVAMLREGPALDPERAGLPAGPG
jgi:type VII secretion protein EccB